MRYYRCKCGNQTACGSLAIFETYKDALIDSGTPHMVHRVEIFIEREPAEAS